jgi:predicted metal-dependent phosphoesterase TrpH
MITRTHFAQMLIQEGICKDMRSVFRRFLTGKKPGGVSAHEFLIILPLPISP